MIDLCVKKMEQHLSVGPRPGHTKAADGDGKYGLRPRTIIKRLQQEKVRQEVPKRPRTKSRPAPLSKYRRKTANARERHRMREINNAFESLRKVLPDGMEVQHSSSTMTKITTLRLAVDYIRALSEVLEDGGNGDLSALQSSLETTIQNSIQSSLQQSLGDTFGTSFQGGPHNMPSGLHLHQEDMTHLLGFYSSNPSSVGRGSLGSSSDLEELLSDDSGLLEDNLDVFHDIPTLPEHDPLQLFLGGGGKDALTFVQELC